LYLANKHKHKSRLGAIFTIPQDGNDVIFGGSGRDNLKGDAGSTFGNDTISGGSGVDNIHDSGGHDVMLGGAGDDKRGV
jgi:Ca2+-binding RTX toxin-like protein